MASKSECIVVSGAQILAKSLMDWNGVFSFHVPRFVAVYLSNQAELDFDTLRKVVDVV